MISFRPLAQADYPMLLEWLQRPHVKQWWNDGDDSLAKVAAHFSSDPSTIERFIALREGVPIGYFQYIRNAAEEIGCDQFLADARRLSKGLGTQCLMAFIDLIIKAEAPRSLTVDPHPDNGRGIRCYEKCGFVHRPERSTADVYFMMTHC